MARKKRRNKPNTSIEIIDIRKKTIRKIIFTEDKRVSRSAILPTKNNKNQGTNVQRQIEHSH